MKRLKTFFIYAILIAALWVFSDFAINLIVNGTSKNIHNGKNENLQQINIEEDKIK